MNPDTQTKIDNATTNLVAQTIASIKRHASIAFTPPQIPADLPWYCHPIFWVFAALTMTVMAVAMAGAYLIAMFFRGAYLAVVLIGAALKRKKKEASAHPSVIEKEHVADRTGLVVDAEESTAGPVNEQPACDGPLEVDDRFDPSNWRKPIQPSSLDEAVHSKKRSNIDIEALKKAILEGQQVVDAAASSQPRPSGLVGAGAALGRPRTWVPNAVDPSTVTGVVIESDYVDTPAPGQEVSADAPLSHKKELVAWLEPGTTEWCDVTDTQRPGLMEKAPLESRQSAGGVAGKTLGGQPAEDHDSHDEQTYKETP